MKSTTVVSNKGLIKLLFINILFFYPIIIDYKYSDLQNIIIGILMVISFFMLLNLLRNAKLSNEILCIAAFEFILFLTSLINFNLMSGYDFLIYTKYMIFTLGFVAFIEGFLKRRPRLFLKSIILVLTVLIIINFLLLIRYPNGLYQASNNYSIYEYSFNIDNAIHFLGHRNNVVMYLFPNLFCSFLYYKIYGMKNLKIIFIFLIVFIESIMIKSATCLVGCLLFTGYVMLFETKKRNNLERVISKIINIKNVLIITLTLYIFVVVFRFQEVFSYLLIDLLQRDINLTGRTTIWDMAFQLIMESPVWGYGTHNSGAIIFSSYKEWYAHNFILDILLQGGVLALIPFISYLGIIAKKMSVRRNEVGNRICTWAIFVILIISMTESYIHYFGFWLVFIVAYNYENILNSKNITEKSNFNII